MTSRKTAARGAICATIGLLASVGLLAGGCAAPRQVADTSRPPVTPSASPSAQADPQAATKAQILDVYAHFTSAYVAAAATSDPTAAELVTYGGNIGGGAGDELQIARNAGIVATGAPQWTAARVTALDAPAGTATVAGCFDAGTWHYVKQKTGRPASPVEINADPAPEPLRPGEAAHPYAVSAKLLRHPAGGWWVQDMQAELENPC